MIKEKGTDELIKELLEKRVNQGSLREERARKSTSNREIYES